MTELLWQAKLAAWIHDPVEKALVLLRDPSGHEGGTVRKLRQRLFPDGIPATIKQHIHQADCWAAAADRPQFPLGKDGGRYQKWTQVNFAEQPVFKHPLTGQEYDLKKLKLEPAQLKAISTDHFQQFIVENNGVVDWHKTALAFWRFGPESPASDFGSLWSLLPADTRIPDHTIWTHLDLTAAFATAFAVDGKHNPALLQMSFGPVQDFIAQARSTSDLWAGSHLLSRIAWEGLKVICERLGPDAVIFPQLRGVALVDLWLQKEMNLLEEWFEKEEWRKDRTDVNPLFAAVLPNKFVAIIPGDQAEKLACEITQRVREWVRTTAEEMLTDLLAAGQFKDKEKILPCWAQLNEQLHGFPEVHWAAVPWSPLVQSKEGDIPDVTELRTAQAPFFPKDKSSFLDSKTWELLSQELQIEKQSFFKPNAGVLYPALYELLEKLGATAKSVRPFAQIKQHGYRDSISGEMEWLTTDRTQLSLSPGQRPKDTLWNKVSGQFSIRKGEHLNTLGMLKRLWPKYFTDQISDLLDKDFRRFVISTHTMALATSLERWLEQPNRTSIPDTLSSQLVKFRDSAVLPRKLAVQLYNESNDADLVARKLPAYLDTLREGLDNSDQRQRDQAERALNLAETDIKTLFGIKPEAYYALIMLDGDKMGAWLSGSGNDGLSYRLPYKATWHPAIREAIQGKFADSELEKYLNEPRAISPSRHMAISAALNVFSLYLVRHVVEDVCKGKLIYSGGDDVLAMVSVDDLLPALLLLRLVYSGLTTDGWEELEQLNLPKLTIRSGGGHVFYNKRLYRVMGDKATASAGAVVAHHTAPLDMVLRQLRRAEKRAKNKGERDAFAITLLKRSGGATELTCKWGLLDKDKENNPPYPLETTPIGLLLRLRDVFAGSMSRRAAYHIQSWIEQLPGLKHFDNDDALLYQNLLIDNLRYQFQRQGGGKQSATIADALGKLAVKIKPETSEQNNGVNLQAAFIRDFLTVAEFLAREGRTGNRKQDHQDD